MTPIEREFYEAGHEEDYRGFRIGPKNDFGQYGYWSPEHRCNLNAGWVICYGSGTYRGCNAAPGATFAWTLKQAREMVDDLIEAGDKGEHNVCGDGVDSDTFWRLNYARHGIAYPPSGARA